MLLTELEGGEADMYLLISDCSKVVEADILRTIDRSSAKLYCSLFLINPNTDVDDDMAAHSCLDFFTVVDQIMAIMVLA